MRLFTHIPLLVSIFMFASALPTETSATILANISDFVFTWDISIPDSTGITDDAPIADDRLVETDSTPNLSKRCGNCHPNHRMMCGKLVDGKKCILQCRGDCWYILDKGRLAKDLCKNRV